MTSVLPDFWGKPGTRSCRGKAWAEWAGVSERTAQGWLRGTRPAPAWAVHIAIQNLEVVDKGAAALELLGLLARRRAEHQ